MAVPPAVSPPATAEPGLHRLGLGDGRDGLLYVPRNHRHDQPAPLVVLLHGAGGTASGGLELLRRFADGSGLVLLAPDSRGRTWDVILGAYGPDVAFLDRAMATAVSRSCVDLDRLAIGGFSDGASYAVSLGITNGDLFRHIIAFSPGFAAPADWWGNPRVFVSHGVHDAVLPIDRCSRRLVPLLRRGGLDVRYREFDGGHTVPAELAEEAVGWLSDQAVGDAPPPPSP